MTNKKMKNTINRMRKQKKTRFKTAKTRKQTYSIRGANK